MKHTILLGASVMLSLALLTSCGTDPKASKAQSPAAAATTAETTADSQTTKDAPKDAAPQVTLGANSITVKGSGNGETAAIAMDQKYYVVKTTNAMASEYGTVQVTVKGQELPASTTLADQSTWVFQPPSPSVVLTIEASGGYTMEFTKPKPVSGAAAAPKTFTGGAGTTVTSMVKTAGTYVNLSLKYTGAADPNGQTGAMLASAQIYDATTGDAVLNVPKYVNKAKTEDSDGRTVDAPSTYFLIVTAQSAKDTWEASITES